jgi:glycosyltransferase involved in cell wall biosynthesis
MKKPIKVLRIINRLNLGGPTYNASYLTSRMYPEFNTLLISGNHDESEASSEFLLAKSGIKARYIKGMYREINFYNDFKAYWEIRKIIKEFKPDIVHTHAAKAGALGRLAAIHEGVPIILHTFHGHVFHSYFNSIKTKLFIKIEQYLARKSSVIIAISELQKKELSEDFIICPKAKVQVVPLGFDLDRFKQDVEAKRLCFRNFYGLENDVIAIGIIGRLVPIKNHKMFINIAKSLASEFNSKIKFFIIGDGEDRLELERYCDEIEIRFSINHWCEENNSSQISFNKSHDEIDIVFCSWMQDVSIAMAGLDLVALTSLNEGTPVSLIEALAASKPVVSTNVGGVADVVQNGITGYLTNVGDELDFIQKIKLLIADAEARKKMGAAGCDYVSKKFGYERLVNEVRSLYLDLLKKIN